MTDPKKRDETHYLMKKQDVYDSKDPVMRLCRIILWRLGITHDLFTRLHTTFWMNQGTKTKTAISSDRNNVLRALESEKLTFSALQSFLLNVLNLDLIRISITVRDRNSGEEHTYSHDDILVDEEAVDSTGKKNPS